MPVLHSQLGCPMLEELPVNDLGRVIAFIQCSLQEQDCKFLLAH